VNSIVKKVIAAIAIKEAIEQIQERRKPKKPSLFQRVMPVGIVAAAAGLGFWVYKNKLQGSPTASYDV
jgi:hypothetical protein